MSKSKNVISNSKNNSKTNSKTQIYYAVDYLRLSKDDNRKKNESNSIANQRKMIEAYVAKNEDIVLVDEAIDDGYTGTNYNRPGFDKVLELIEAGKVNCVIVKDLSRMGREYIETGKYIEMTFPEKNVRFIAINDDVDSENRSYGDELMIPFKNLMNENYCRELSNKLRKQFKIQRDNGEFIQSFAPYGYKRDPEDKHKIIIDEYPAEIVRGIYSMTLQGYSPARIAKYLNDNDVVAPYEYKRETSNYVSGFKGAGKSVWNHKTIGRILRNKIYIGTLIQGRTSTPSFKIKKAKLLSEDQWSIVEDNHEPIIDIQVFNTVQRILSRDTRLSVSEDRVLPLAGSVFCGDCGNTLARRTVHRCGKPYYYYWCGNYKNNGQCTTHNISQIKLEKAVLDAIRTQIDLVIELDSLMKEIDAKSIATKKIERFNTIIREKQLELDKATEKSQRLYESYTDEILGREEYLLVKDRYTNKMDDIQKEIEELEKSIENVKAGNVMDQSWVTQFIKYKDQAELSHEMVVSLVTCIEVFEDKRIQITFNFKDELKEYIQIVKSIREEAI